MNLEYISHSTGNELLHSLLFKGFGKHPKPFEQAMPELAAYSETERLGTSHSSASNE